MAGDMLRERGRLISNTRKQTTFSLLGTVEKKVATLPTICGQTYIMPLTTCSEKKKSLRAVLVQCSLLLFHSNKHLAELCAMYLATFDEFVPKKKSSKTRYFRIPEFRLQSTSTVWTQQAFLCLRVPVYRELKMAVRRRFLREACTNSLKVLSSGNDGEKLRHGF